MTIRRSGLVQVVAVLVFAVCIGALGAASFAATQAGEKMHGKDRFLIISPHTPEQCLAVLDEMVAKNPALLARTDWGCMSGDHTGYTIVEAASADAAREMLPESVRADAKVIKLNKFTPEQIKSFHSQH